MCRIRERKIAEGEKVNRQKGKKSLVVGISVTRC